MSNKRNKLGLYQKKDYRRKARQVLLSAVIGTALIGTSFSPVYASEDTETSEEAVHMIPDIITVDELVSLGEISLPSSSMGKLKWADPDQMPSESGESFEVILVPDEGVDLSEYSGWDEEEGVLRGYTEIVLAYHEEAEAPEEETESTAEEETGAPEEEAEESMTEEEQKSDLVTEEKIEASEEDIEKSEAAEEKDPEMSADTEEEITNTEKENADPKEEAGEKTEEAPESADAAPEEKPETGTIFEEDAQPDPVPDVDLDTEMTEEEMAAQGRINHTSSGITVSGPNLPWYVQFRVYDADGYSFSIEDSADIFRSYEFVLWDLQNDCEYEIADGDYVSVVVPVMTGYDYTVEHILDNGAVETIVPTMVGSSVVFSTHSLSPFGIAGSVNIVGGEVGEENYVSVTPTPTSTPRPTKAPSATQTPRPDPTKAPSGQNAGQTTQTVPTIIPQGGSASGNSGSGTGGSTGSSDDDHTVSSGNGAYQGNSNSQSVQTPTAKPAGPGAVQTGDDTPILGYVGMLLAAGAVLTGILLGRKKSERS